MASVTVDVDDVAARYEGTLLDEFREEYVEAQVADAVSHSDDRWGARINARLAAGTLSHNSYKRVIANAVLRVLRNPDGFSSENEGGYGNSRRASVASGDLWFSSDEQEQLTGIPAKRSSVPGTVGIGIDRGWR